MAVVFDGQIAVCFFLGIVDADKKIIKNASVWWSQLHYTVCLLILWTLSVVPETQHFEKQFYFRLQRPRFETCCAKGSNVRLLTLQVSGRISLKRLGQKSAQNINHIYRFTPVYKTFMTACIQLALGRIKWCASTNTVMNPWAQQPASSDENPALRSQAVQRDGQICSPNSPPHGPSKHLNDSLYRNRTRWRSR